MIDRVKCGKASHIVIALLHFDVSILPNAKRHCVYASWMKYTLPIYAYEVIVVPYLRMMKKMHFGGN
jgi:hypothetical protein